MCCRGYVRHSPTGLISDPVRQSDKTAPPTAGFPLRKCQTRRRLSQQRNELPQFCLHEDEDCSLLGCDVGYFDTTFSEEPAASTFRVESWELKTKLQIQWTRSKAPRDLRGRSSGHVGLVNCCWPSPAQWFLSMTTTGLTTVYCLTALGYIWIQKFSPKSCW
jgi:hypothetical protein